MSALTADYQMQQWIKHCTKHTYTHTHSDWTRSIRVDLARFQLNRLTPHPSALNLSNLKNHSEMGETIYLLKKTRQKAILISKPRCE